MADSRIYLRNKPYFLYDTYTSRNEAYRIAQWAKKKYKTRYFIQKVETTWGGLKYRLYFDRLRGIWS